MNIDRDFYRLSMGILLVCFDDGRALIIDIPQDGSAGGQSEITPMYARHLKRICGYLA